HPELRRSIESSCRSRGLRKSHGTDHLFYRNDIAVVSVLCVHCHDAGRAVYLQYVGRLLADQGIQILQELAVRLEVILIPVDVIPSIAVVHASVIAIISVLSQSVPSVRQTCSVFLKIIYILSYLLPARSHDTVPAEIAVCAVNLYPAG